MEERRVCGGEHYRRSFYQTFINYYSVKKENWKYGITFK